MQAMDQIVIFSQPPLCEPCGCERDKAGHANSGKKLYVPPMSAKVVSPLANWLSFGLLPNFGLAALYLAILLYISVVPK